VTCHNLHFYLDPMRHARNAILSGTYPDFHAAFIADYSSASARA
jgi:queuine/archaeosine tRNA-ribosyltransferase